VTPCCQVTTTFPDRALAEQVARRLVEERLAACVQVQGPIASTYRWQSELESASEWYCHVKTTVARLPDLRTRLRELHPYQVAEIIAVPILDGDPAYLQWIEESVRSIT
jgi:periplasmic divalent cation tolerance protein